MKYRPNFSTVDGVVKQAGHLFKKISGVKDQKTEEYWISVKQLMTPETVVIDRPRVFTIRITEDPD